MVKKNEVRVLRKKMFDDFSVLLETCKKEEEINQFLKKHQYILINCFLPMVGNIAVFSKPKLGNDFIPDFVIFNLVSGHIDLIFIELKKPTSKAYTKQGVDSRYLTQAKKQISQWESWLLDNIFCFIKYIEKKLVNHTGLFHFYENYDFTDELDTSKYFYSYQPRISYKIIIGRRRDLNSEQNKRRNAEFNMTVGSVEIVTYDRLLKASLYAAEIEKFGLS